MPSKKNNDSVIALCVQEPLEDGSVMDFGAMSSDEVKFLHQAFITDTLATALQVEEADLRLYAIDIPERKRLVAIVTDYLSKKLSGKSAQSFKSRFSRFEQDNERWGIRAHNIFTECFAKGYKNVLLIGSRTPTVTADKMRTALKMLRESDAVFGPTPEGRYYMLGLSKKPHIDLSAFDWKSPSIYNEVSNALDEKELSWSELEIWYAVESPEELEIMARDINQYRFEGDEITAHETEIVIGRLLTKLEG